ncbi:MAG: KaiC domain-containing protein [Thermoplasmata archaeon]|nr:MAG: KaiC domain-containing protein [Thermoplasmata archaeon]
MSVEHVYELGELKARAPKLFGVRTGTRLDEMFFKVEIEDGRPVKRPLGGVPYLSVINVTGIPDTGKSLLAEQFAVTQASMGYPVLFVTVESPANFLYTAIKQRCEALGLDFGEVEKNMIVVDASEDPSMREDLTALFGALEYAIRKKNTKNMVIDSVTGLYEHAEVKARMIVRRIYNFAKKFRQTTLLVSQKRSSQASETAEAAGGLAVAHIVDGTIVLDKQLIATRWDENTYGLPIGSVLRTIRIDGCRLSPHDTRTWVFEISDLGTIEIKEPLSEFIAKRRKS